MLDYFILKILKVDQHTAAACYSCSSSQIELQLIFKSKLINKLTGRGILTFILSQPIGMHQSIHMERRILRQF